MTTRTVLSSTIVGVALVGAVTLGAPAVAQDWSGFYAGASLGYGDVKSSTGDLGNSTNDTLYSFYGGYMADLGTFVIGGEYEYAVATDSTNVDVPVESAGRAKVRLGYDAGVILPYALLGWSNLATGDDIAGDDSGYTYGIGADYRVSDNILVGAEILRIEVDDFGNTQFDYSATSYQLRVSYKF